MSVLNGVTNQQAATDPFLERARQLRSEHASRRGRAVDGPPEDNSPVPYQRGSVTAAGIRRIQIVYPAVPGPPAGVLGMKPSPYGTPSPDPAIGPELAALLDDLGVDLGTLASLYAQAQVADGQPAEGDEADGPGVPFGALSGQNLQALADRIGLDVEGLRSLVEDVVPVAEVGGDEAEPTADPALAARAAQEGDGYVSSLPDSALLWLRAQLGALAPDLDNLENAASFADFLYRLSLMIAQARAVHQPSDGQDVPNAIEESLGAGLAKAIALDEGQASARTAPQSQGNATAESRGKGNSTAETGAGSIGNAFARSSADGHSLAETGPLSTGDALASSEGPGNAVAQTGQEAAGSASARGQGAGAAEAVVGDGAKGSVSAYSFGEGPASAETGAGSGGRAHALNQGTGDVRASTGEASAGDAIAQGFSAGSASAQTGDYSAGSSMALSYSAGDAIARGGDGSRGATRAAAHGLGDATAESHENSTGNAIAEAFGEGGATAVVDEASLGSAIAKSRGQGFALAETGKGATSSAEAIAESDGSATAGTGDAAKGNAIAMSHGAGHATALTGDESKGRATAIAGEKGGSATAVVTNDALGSVSAVAIGRGDVFGVADGKGALRVAAERDGGLFVAHTGRRAMVAENKSDRDIGILNLTDKAVKVEVTASGIVKISVAGLGTGSFGGNSFTILENGAILEQNLENPVPPAEPGALPELPGSVGLSPVPSLVLESGSQGSRDEDSVALRVGGDPQSSAGATTLASSTPLTMSAGGPGAFLPPVQSYGAYDSGPARLDLQV